MVTMYQTITDENILRVGHDYDDLRFLNEDESDDDMPSFTLKEESLLLEDIPRLPDSTLRKDLGFNEEFGGQFLVPSRDYHLIDDIETKMPPQDFQYPHLYPEESFDNEDVQTNICTIPDDLLLNTELDFSENITSSCYDPQGTPTASFLSSYFLDEPDYNDNRYAVKQKSTTIEPTMDFLHDSISSMQFGTTDGNFNASHERIQPDQSMARDMFSLPSYNICPSSPVHQTIEADLQQIFSPDASNDIKPDLCNITPKRTCDTSKKNEKKQELQAENDKSPSIPDNGIIVTSTLSTAVRSLVTDFTNNVFNELEIVSFGEKDRKGNRTKVPIGFPGMACQHCKGKTMRTGRYFPSSLKTMADSKKTLYAIQRHMLSCKSCPEDTKERIKYSFEKHVEEIQSKTKRHGSQRAYFRKVWESMHPKDEEGGNKKKKSCSK